MRFPETIGRNHARFHRLFPTRVANAIWNISMLIQHRPEASRLSFRQRNTPPLLPSLPYNDGGSRCLSRRSPLTLDLSMRIQIGLPGRIGNGESMQWRILVATNFTDDASRIARNDRERRHAKIDDGTCTDNRAFSDFCAA